MWMPSAARSGEIRFFHSCDCAVVSSSTRSRIAASPSWGDSPSSERTESPDAAWSIRPATRTMKNSSRLDEKIEQNFTRSSSGVDSSAASSSTRALKSSHESSRLISAGGEGIWVGVFVFATSSSPQG